MTTRVPCPACRERGEDRQGNNLCIKDGWGRCFKCGHKQRVDEEMQYEQKPKPEDVGFVKSLPISALQHKPISKEICELFGVRVLFDETDRSVKKVFYPYDNGYKVRVVATKDFYGVGQKPKNLFGKAQCKGNAKILIIVEGEDDCLATKQMLLLKGKDYNVVSIPHGAQLEGDLDKAIADDLEWVCCHKTVFLCLDQDKVGQATQGRIAEALAALTQVKTVKLPRKDAGDMLIHGEVDKFISCFYGATEFQPEYVVRGCDISFEEMIKPKSAGYSTPYSGLDRKLHGIRKGEITTFCAGSGIGKSTIVKEIGYHFVKQHGLTVATVALETPLYDSARSYIAIDNNVPVAKLQFNPGMIEQGRYRQSFDELIASNKTHFFNHFGSLNSQKLLYKLHYFVKGLGCDFIILDHVSMVVAGEESSNERKDLDMLMEKMTDLVVTTGVGILAVAHLKRVPGKNYNKGDEVELTDLRGSAGLEQMSWNVVGLERDQQSEDKCDFSKIRVLKNRTWGFTGIADSLGYSHETGRLLPITY